MQKRHWPQRYLSVSASDHCLNTQVQAVERDQALQTAICRSTVVINTPLSEFSYTNARISAQRLGGCPIKPGMTDLDGHDWLGSGITGFRRGRRDQKKEKSMIFMKIRTEAMVFRPVPVMKPRKEPKATLRA